MASVRHLNKFQTPFQNVRELRFNLNLAMLQKSGHPGLPSNHRKGERERKREREETERQRERETERQRDRETERREREREGEMIQMETKPDGKYSKSKCKSTTSANLCTISMIFAIEVTM